MSFGPVAVGDTIAGKYLVERMIGEGGMGVVVAARHLELDQIVAIKFLLTDIAKLDMAPERFRREAWAAARIRGEHVCRVLDVGTVPSGVPFMVMEYLDGCDLATELAARKSIPAEEAVDYVLQTCEALAEAHAAGIVHRDLKPANLFLARRADGSRAIKVLDFGVSKVLSETGRAALSLTSTKTVVGSPLYMSPEQLDSAKGVDARTDIWALGVVLYELITGSTPFNGDSIAQLVSGVLHADPPPFVEVGAVPMGDLEAVLRRAVSKKREDRYANVAELAAELVPFGPAHAAQSALRASRMLAREGASSLPLSPPSGERVHTPRGSLEDRTPDPANPAPEARTPTPRGNGARDSTPVGWEARPGGPGKRAGAIAVGLLGAAALGFVILRDQPPPAPPGAGPEDPPLPAAVVSGAQELAPAAANVLQAGAPAPVVPGGIVDAGISPEPPPVEPPAPEPARAARQPSSAIERSAERAARSRRPAAAEAAQPAPSSAASGGISDFGGRR